MECKTCKTCNSCNNDGCYYCVDYAFNGEKYICTCSDGNNCANKIGEEND